MNRSRHIIALVSLTEEEMPVDQDAHWLEPKRIGGTGARPPAGDHMPRKGIGGIPMSSPNYAERKEVQNTFPWNGQPIRNPNQLHIYGDTPSGIGGTTL